MPTGESVEAARQSLTGIGDRYAKIGFGHPLGVGDSVAVVVVDFVRAYLEPRFPFFIENAADEVVPAATAVLGTARELGLPIVYTRLSYDERGSNGGLFFQRVKSLQLFVEGGGSEAADIPESIAPEEGESVILKQYPSAFFGTPLVPMLTQAKVDTVAILGFSTSGCVRATALDAMCFGFRPVVVSDGVGDHSDPHRANLFDLGSKYADVMTSQELIAQLRTP